MTVNNRRLHCFQQAGVSCICANLISKGKRRILAPDGGRRIRFRPGDFEKYARSLGLDETTEAGCWIFTTQSHRDKSQRWTLWYADQDGECATGYTYPHDARFVRDGSDGLWCLCQTSGAKLWNLWHVSAKAEYNTNYKYPSDLRMISDSSGGVWMLCQTHGESSWKTWHVNGTDFTETKLYDYPWDSKIVPGGNGGILALCETKGTPNKCHNHWALWKATKVLERNTELAYPSGSSIAGDGEAGAWILCRTKGQRLYGLWQASAAQNERHNSCFPLNSTFTSASNCLWALCSTRGTNQWGLWRVDQSSLTENHLYEYPEHSKRIGTESYPLIG